VENTVSFPITFPNICFSVTATQNSSDGVYENIAVVSVTNSNFYLDVAGNVRNFNAFWIAIGY
jgi:ABC-type transport system involved in cytochrome c biogenesis permease component